MKLIASILLATATLAHAELKVAVGDITDSRTTGKSFNGMSVDLKLSGPEMADCKGLRVVLKEAKDDAGKTIPMRQGFGNDGSFKAPQKAFGGFKKDKNAVEEYQLKLDMENPLRTAKSLTVDASIELLMPSKDPNSQITVPVAAEAGKPLGHEALKTAGVTIIFKEAKDTEVSYSISDPNQKVATLEFCAPDGKPLETSGRFSSSFGGAKSVSVTLRAKAPEGITAKIYLVTDKSVVSVPLKLTAVTLP